MATIKIPPSFRQSTVVRELAVETWGSIFEVTGLRDNIHSNLTHDIVSGYLTSNDVVDESLFDALQKINNLGDSFGRNLIEQAADDVGINLTLNDDESDRELAARLWILSRKKKEYLQVLARADAAFGFCKAPRNYKEFAGETSIQTEGFDKDKFKDLVCNWCLQNNKSGVVDIFVYSFDETWCCDIVRGDPIKVVSEIRDDHQAALSYRPAIQDHITVEPESGRIRILSKSQKLIKLYRETMGEILANSSSFFSTESICTLIPLQKKGASLFDDTHFPEIQRVTVTELTWRRGDRDTLIVKGRDCLKLLNDLSARLDTGVLIEAKLRFAIAGESRPVFSVLKVPSKISISREEYEPLIYRYLDCVGLRGRFNVEEHKNFWELEPWHYSESGWRKLIQGSFDRLKLANCLINAPLETVRHPDEDNHAGVMTVETDGAGTAIAVSDDLGLRSLTSTDVEGYKLNITKVVSLVQKALEIAVSAQELINGLWYLGRIQLSESEYVQAFFATACQSAGIDNLIHQYASGSKSILILPDGCTYNSKIKYIFSDVLNLYFEDLLARIVRSLELTKSADPARWCSADLVIDRERELVWFKKEKLSTLGAGTHPYKFLVMVAEGEGTEVSDDDIASHLTCSTEGNVVRKAKSALVKTVMEELGLSGKDASKDLSDQLFKRRIQAWALNCSVEFIS